MNEIECPYCGSSEVDWVERAQLYQCDDCGEYFEDDVPPIERRPRAARTKLHREE